MDYIFATSLISFLGASFILIKRVHENRIIGISGDNAYDPYWPFSVIWLYIYDSGKKLFLIIYSFLAPYLQNWIGIVASKLYKLTLSASHHFLQLSNLIHGKGSLKKNTGNTSLFIRDISGYKKSDDAK